MEEIEFQVPEVLSGNIVVSHFDEKLKILFQIADNLPARGYPINPSQLARILKAKFGAKQYIDRTTLERLRYNQIKVPETVHQCMLSLFGLTWPIQSYYDPDGMGRDQDPDQFARDAWAQLGGTRLIRQERNMTEFPNRRLLKLLLGDVSTGMDYQGELTVFAGEVPIEDPAEDRQGSIIGTAGFKSLSVYAFYSPASIVRGSSVPAREEERPYAVTYGPTNAAEEWQLTATPTPSCDKPYLFGDLLTGRLQVSSLTPDTPLTLYVTAPKLRLEPIVDETGLSEAEAKELKNRARHLAQNKVAKQYEDMSTSAYSEPDAFTLAEVHFKLKDGE